MARVPVPAAGSGADRVSLPGGRFQPVQHSGLAQAGEALQRAGRFGFDYAEEQERIDLSLDRAAVRKADNEAARVIRERLWTGEDAFYSKEGFNAANARPQVESDLTALRDKTMEGLTTDRQRVLFSELFDRRLGAEQQGVARHAAEQVRREELRQSSARIVEASNDAVARWDNPELRETAIQTAIGELRSQAVQSGWAPETLAGAEREARSTIHSRIVRSLIGRGKVEQASAYRQEMGEELEPDAAAQIDDLLFEPLLDREADQAVDILLGIVPDESAPAADDAPDGEGDEEGEGYTPPEAATAVPTMEEMTAAFRGVRVRLGIAPADKAPAPVRQTAALPSPTSISSGKGRRKAPKPGASSNHRGVDYALPEGTPIVAMYDGVVVAPTRSARGYGNRVQLDHGGSRETFYGHMSKTAGLKVGAQVKRGQVIGYVGSTGVSTGPHVHIEEVVAGKFITPGSGGEVEVRPGGGVRAQASRARPGDPGVQQEPRQHDLSQALARLDGLKLPFELEQRVRQRLMARVSLDETLLRRREDQAAQQAWEVVEKLGEGFTNMSQIPLEIRGGMSAHQRVQFDAVAERNRQPKPPETNWQKYAQYSDLYATNPAAFKNLSPAELRANLSDGDFEQVMGWRRDVLAAASPARPKPASQVEHSRIRSVIDPLLSAAGIVPPVNPPGKAVVDPAKLQQYHARVAAFQRAVQDDVAGYTQRTGKAPDDNAIRDMADRQLMRVWQYGGKEADAAFAFETPRGSRVSFRIPGAEARRIRAAYIAVHRRTPTDDEISEIYRYGPRGGR